jgi:predicted AAA+ superfamily ATPase
MIQREIRKSIEEKLFKGKVIILLGPRQVGKTTLLREIIKGKSDALWLNADEPDIQALFENATSTRLKNYFGTNKLIVIDEAQTLNDVGIKLKIINDSLKDIQVIATGSSAFEIKNKTNEPLTGRKWQFQLFPFSFAELVKHHGLIEEKRMLPVRLLYGSYPEIALNSGEEKQRLKLLTDSYLYKDVLMFEGLKMPDKLIHLLQLLAFRIGTEINYNNLSKELKIDNSTVEKYIQLLEDSFIIFRLKALSRNHSKELKKGRKIYFIDNGVVNALLGNFNLTENRADIGALWENYVISEIYKKYSYENRWVNLYFWRTQDQQEIDLVIEENQAFHAFEIKWNKNVKARLSKTFSRNYENHSFHVITPENVEDYLLEQVNLEKR